MPSTTPHHYQTAARAITYLSKNAERQPSLEELAAALHVSRFHLQKLFTNYVGVSPKKFLQHLSLTKAREALSRGATTLQATHAVGLSSQSRLHDLFLTLEACTPGQFKRRGAGLELNYLIQDTLFGPTLVVQSPVGICRVAFADTAAELRAELPGFYPAASWREGSTSLLERALARISGQPADSTTALTLDLVGTEFQQQVWRALLTIPTGELVTYGDVAASIGKPSAARAVGTAIGRNNIALLIPCHRVIQASGALGGYRWGAGRKQALLGLELGRTATDEQPATAAQLQLRL